jgi:hypothetical protein
MRALIGAMIGLTALAGAVYMAAADATTRGYPGGPYQVYIFNSADRPAVDLYAFSVGQRATVARVEDCIARLADDPHRIVADLRERSRNEDHRLSVVWIEGEGSDTHIGGCDASDRDADPEIEHDPVDSMVVLRDTSAAQVRHLIGEIHGLSAQDRTAMTEALGLNRPARARR